GRALRIVEPALAHRPLASCRIRTARFIDPSERTSYVVPLDESNTGGPDLVVAARADFDAQLLAAARDAGAAVIATRVADVEVNAGEVRVVTTSRATYRASFVVGADGANSLVRRRIVRPFSRHDL